MDGNGYDDEQQMRKTEIKGILSLKMMWHHPLNTRERGGRHIYEPILVLLSLVKTISFDRIKEWCVRRNRQPARKTMKRIIPKKRKTNCHNLAGICYPGVMISDLKMAHNMPT
jgi:hypothetical protein